MLVSEIFEKVCKAKSKKERVKVLQENQSQAVFAVLQLNYNPTYKMLLPEGTPPYKKEEDKPIGYQQTNIANELRRFYIWLDHSQNIPALKRETLFIEMLEGLHTSEAELLCAAKDKRLTTIYKQLTEAVAREAFPSIFPPKPARS